VRGHDSNSHGKEMLPIFLGGGVLSLGLLEFWVVCAGWMYVLVGCMSSLQLKHVPKAYTYFGCMTGIEFWSFGVLWC